MRRSFRAQASGIGTTRDPGRLRQIRLSEGPGRAATRHAAVLADAIPIGEISDGRDREDREELSDADVQPEPESIGAARMVETEPEDDPEESRKTIPR